MSNQTIDYAMKYDTIIDYHLFKEPFHVLEDEER